MTSNSLYLYGTLCWSSRSRRLTSSPRAIKWCFIPSILHIGVCSFTQQQSADFIGVPICGPVQWCITSDSWFVNISPRLQKEFGDVSSVESWCTMKGCPTIPVTHMHRHSILQESINLPDVTLLCCTKEAANELPISF